MHSLIEFFVFPLLVVAAAGIIGNFMKWPGARRIKGLAVVLGLAVLAAFGWNATKEKTPAANITSTNNSGDASTTGAQSPAITAPGNSVNYGGNTTVNGTQSVVNAPNSVIIAGSGGDPQSSAKNSPQNDLFLGDKPAGRTADEWFVGDWYGWDYHQQQTAPASAAVAMGSLGICTLQESNSADLSTKIVKKGRGTGVLSIAEEGTSPLGNQFGCSGYKCSGIYEARFKVPSDFGGASLEAILRPGSDTVGCATTLAQTLTGMITEISDLQIRLQTNDSKIDLTLSRKHW